MFCTGVNVPIIKIKKSDTPKKILTNNVTAISSYLDKNINQLCDQLVLSFIKQNYSIYYNVIYELINVYNIINNNIDINILIKLINYITTCLDNHVEINNTTKNTMISQLKNIVIKLFYHNNDIPITLPTPPIDINDLCIVIDTTNPIQYDIDKAITILSHYDDLYVIYNKLYYSSSELYEKKINEIYVTIHRSLIKLSNQTTQLELNSTFLEFSKNILKHIMLTLLQILNNIKTYTDVQEKFAIDTYLQYFTEEFSVSDITIRDHNVSTKILQPKNDKSSSSSKSIGGSNINSNLNKKYILDSPINYIIGGFPGDNTKQYTELYDSRFVFKYPTGSVRLKSIDKKVQFIFSEVMRIISSHNVARLYTLIVYLISVNNILLSTYEYPNIEFKTNNNNVITSRNKTFIDIMTEMIADLVVYTKVMLPNTDTITKVLVNRYLITIENNITQLINILANCIIKYIFLLIIYIIYIYKLDTSKQQYVHGLEDITTNYNFKIQEILNIFSPSKFIDIVLDLIEYKNKIFELKQIHIINSSNEDTISTMYKDILLLLSSMTFKLVQDGIICQSIQFNKIDANAMEENIIFSKNIEKELSDKIVEYYNVQKKSKLIYIYNNNIILINEINQVSHDIKEDGKIKFIIEFIQKRLVLINEEINVFKELQELLKYIIIEIDIIESTLYIISNYNFIKKCLENIHNTILYLKTYHKEQYFIALHKILTSGLIDIDSINKTSPTKFNDNVISIEKSAEYANILYDEIEYITNMYSTSVSKLDEAQQIFNAINSKLNTVYNIPTKDIIVYSKYEIFINELLENTDFIDEFKNIETIDILQFRKNIFIYYFNNSKIINSLLSLKEIMEFMMLYNNIKHKYKDIVEKLEIDIDVLFGLYDIIDNKSLKYFYSIVMNILYNINIKSNKSYSIDDLFNIILKIKYVKILNYYIYTIINNIEGFFKTKKYEDSSVVYFLKSFSNNITITSNCNIKLRELLAMIIKHYYDIRAILSFKYMLNINLNKDVAIINLKHFSDVNFILKDENVEKHQLSGLFYLLKSIKPGLRDLINFNKYKILNDYTTIIDSDDFILKNGGSINNHNISNNYIPYTKNIGGALFDDISSLLSMNSKPITLTKLYNDTLVAGIDKLLPKYIELYDLINNQKILSIKNNILFTILTNLQKILLKTLNSILQTVVNNLEYKILHEFYEIIIDILLRNINYILDFNTYITNLHQIVLFLLKITNNKDSILHYYNIDNYNKPSHYIKKMLASIKILELINKNAYSLIADSNIKEIYKEVDFLKKKYEELFNSIIFDYYILFKRDYTIVNLINRNIVVIPVKVLELSKSSIITKISISKLADIEILYALPFTTKEKLSISSILTDDATLLETAYINNSKLCYTYINNLKGVTGIYVEPIDNSNIYGISKTTTFLYLVSFDKIEVDADVSKKESVIQSDSDESVETNKSIILYPTSDYQFYVKYSKNLLKSFKLVANKILTEQVLPVLIFADTTISSIDYIYFIDCKKTNNIETNKSILSGIKYTEKDGIDEYTIESLHLTKIDNIIGKIDIRQFKSLLHLIKSDSLDVIICINSDKLPDISLLDNFKLTVDTKQECLSIFKLSVFTLYIEPKSISPIISHIDTSEVISIENLFNNINDDTDISSTDLVSILYKSDVKQDIYTTPQEKINKQLEDYLDALNQPRIVDNDVRIILIYFTLVQIIIKDVQNIIKIIQEHIENANEHELIQLINSLRSKLNKIIYILNTLFTKNKFSNNIINITTYILVVFNYYLTSIDYVYVFMCISNLYNTLILKDNIEFHSSDSYKKFVDNLVFVISEMSMNKQTFTTKTIIDNIQSLKDYSGTKQTILFNTNLSITKREEMFSNKDLIDDSLIRLSKIKHDTSPILANLDQFYEKFKSYKSTNKTLSSKKEITEIDFVKNSTDSEFLLKSATDKLIDKSTKVTLTLDMLNNCVKVINSVLPDILSVCTHSGLLFQFIQYGYKMSATVFETTDMKLLMDKNESIKHLASSTTHGIDNEIDQETEDIKISNVLIFNRTKYIINFILMQLLLHTYKGNKKIFNNVSKYYKLYTVFYLSPSYINCEYANFIINLKSQELYNTFTILTNTKNNNNDYLLNSLYVKAACKFIMNKFSFVDIYISHTLFHLKSDNIYFSYDMLCQINNTYKKYFILPLHITHNDISEFNFIIFDNKLHKIYRLYTNTMLLSKNKKILRSINFKHKHLNLLYTSVISGYISDTYISSKKIFAEYFDTIETNLVYEYKKNSDKYKIIKTYDDVIDTHTTIHIKISIDKVNVVDNLIDIIKNIPDINNEIKSDEYDSDLYLFYFFKIYFPQYVYTPVDCTFIQDKILNIQKTDQILLNYYLLYSILINITADYLDIENVLYNLILNLDNLEQINFEHFKYVLCSVLYTYILKILHGNTIKIVLNETDIKDLVNKFDSRILLIGSSNLTVEYKCNDNITVTINNSEYILKTDFYEEYSDILCYILFTYIFKSDEIFFDTNEYLSSESSKSTVFYCNFIPKHNKLIKYKPDDILEINTSIVSDITNTISKLKQSLKLITEEKSYFNITKSIQEYIKILEDNKKDVLNMHKKILRRDFSIKSVDNKHNYEELVTSSYDVIFICDELMTTFLEDTKQLKKESTDNLKEFIELKDSYNKYLKYCKKIDFYDKTLQIIESQSILNKENCDKIKYEIESMKTNVAIFNKKYNIISYNGIN